MRRDLGARVVADAVQLLGAEHHVLEHREVVGEHEVLEHHADAVLDGVGRRLQVTSVPPMRIVPSSGRWTP